MTSLEEFEIRVYEAGTYWANVIDVDMKRQCKLADSILKCSCDADMAMRKFCQDFSSSFFKYYSVAEQYLSANEQLYRKMMENIERVYSIESNEWVEANKKLQEYSERKTTLHRALSVFVVSIFRKLSGVDEPCRLTVLRETDELRKKFIGIIDYHDKRAKTLLSSWSCYAEMQKGAAIITLLEMAAHFSNAYQKRIGYYENMAIMDSLEEKKMAILNICKVYSALYLRYSSYDVDSYEYEFCLVNYYSAFLFDTLKLGTIAHEAISVASCGNWKKCSRLMLKLIQDERTPIAKKNEWCQLSVKMKQIIV